MTQIRNKKKEQKVHIHIISWKTLDAVKAIKATGLILNWNKWKSCFEHTWIIKIINSQFNLFILFLMNQVFFCVISFNIMSMFPFVNRSMRQGSIYSLKGIAPLTTYLLHMQLLLNMLEELPTKLATYGAKQWN